MGCVSSKILLRTGSSKEEASESFPKGSTRLEDLLASKNGGDQFLALLCTANTVAKKLKTASLTDIAQTAPIEITNSISIKIQDTASDDYKFQHQSHEQEANSKRIEAQEATSDTYEAINIESVDSSIDEIEYQKFRGDLRAKSIRTVENFDATVEKIQLKEVGKDEQCDSSEKGWKRKAMGKELANIEVSSFEFSRIGSLREWLIVGNQVISPESYVTPKFGSFGVSLPENVDNLSKEPVFHPEIVSQFEEDMEKLNIEEDHILKQIVEDG